MRFNLIVLTTLVLTACASASGNVRSQYDAAANREMASMKAAEPALVACRNKYVVKDRVPPKNAVKHVDCLADVLNAKVLPNAVFPDLFIEWLTKEKRNAITFSKGKIDRDEVNLRSVQLRNEYGRAVMARAQQDLNQAIVYDQQMAVQRQAAFQNFSQQLQAQEMANQRALDSMPAPTHTTCRMIGNTMHCNTL